MFIDDLPAGWEWKTIGEVTSPIEKVDPKEKPNKEFFYLDIASVDNSLHRITAPKSYYGSNAPSRARQLVRANDVLFSTVRTYLENIAQVPDIYDGQIASTGFSVLRANELVLAKYLLYYSLSQYLLSPLNELQRGTSYPAVRDNDVRSQVIPLAPLPEQCRIVAKIEELFSQLDAGVKALKQTQTKLKRYKASVLEAACEGRLVPTEAELARKEGREYERAAVLLERIARDGGVTDGNYELPEGWAWATIGDVTRPIEKRNPGENPEKGIRYIDIASIDNSSNEVISHKIYLGKDAPSRARQVIEAGDVLFSTVRTYLRNVAVVPEKHGGQFASTGFSILRGKDGILNKYLFIYSLGEGLNSRLADLQRGTSYPAIRDVDMREQPIPVPPGNEQRRIVDELERRFTYIKTIEKVTEINLERVETLRQAILKYAFEGKLVQLEERGT